MTRYIYLDETEFEYKNEQWIGYGALVTEEEIPQNLIDNALITLEKFKNDKDIDYTKHDDSTLKFKIFHSSTDTCCAHTALCKEIENINGKISISIFKKQTHLSLEYLAMLSGIEALETEKPVLFIFENRNNLTKHKIKEQIENTDKYRLASIASMVPMPFYFPLIKYQIADKKVPGLQFIDFILWAYQRSLTRKDDWLQRIKSNSKKYKKTLSISMESFINDSDGVNFNMDINKGVESDLEYFNLYNQYNAHSTENIGEREIEDILQAIYVTLYKLFKDKHLINVPPIENATKKVLYEEDSPVGVIIMFLRLFDMVGYISKHNPQNFNEYWLTLKKVAAETLCKKNQDLRELRLLQFNKAWNSFKSKNYLNFIRTSFDNRVACLFRLPLSKYYLP